MPDLGFELHNLKNIPNLEQLSAGKSIIKYVDRRNLLILYKLEVELCLPMKVIDSSHLGREKRHKHHRRFWKLLHLVTCKC